MKRHSRHSMQGFTLVEVMVAIAIFAVLSAMGWQVFDQLLKNRDRNTAHALALSQLQHAYGQMLRDFNQAVPLSGRSASSTEQQDVALTLDNEHVAFNKSGVVDVLQLGLQPFEHIEYRYDSGRHLLLRYRYPLYQDQSSQSRAETVLSRVDQLQFEALDPAPVSHFPTSQMATLQTAQPNPMRNQLPKGIAIRFEQAGVSYRWVFALVNTLKLTDNPPAGAAQVPQGTPPASPP